MTTEPNKLAAAGIDMGCPGGDRTVMAFWVDGGRTYIGQAFIAQSARRTGKSELNRWLRLWRQGKYFHRISVEKALCGKRLSVRPKPGKLRHYTKLERYGMRALTGRG